MNFNAKEIKDYLTELPNKPYNVSIRLFNKPTSYTFPLITIGGPKKEDYVMYNRLVKLKKVIFTIEIYAGYISENDEVIEPNEVIDTISEWLDSAIKEKYGMKAEFSSPLLPYGQTDDIYRQVISYTGILSNDGYIYQK